MIDRTEATHPPTPTASLGIGTQNFVLDLLGHRRPRCHGDTVRCANTRGHINRGRVLPPRRPAPVRPATDARGRVVEGLRIRRVPRRRESHTTRCYVDIQSDSGNASENAERKSGYWNSKPASCSFFGTADLDGAAEVRFDVLTRVDTSIEAEYYRHGGLLPYVLRQMLAAE